MSSLLQNDPYCHKREEWKARTKEKVGGDERQTLHFLLFTHAQASKLKGNIVRVSPYV